MTRKLIEEYNKWELEVNLQKTEYTCIRRDQKELVLTGGIYIRCCSYLGVKTMNNGMPDRERNNQGQAAIHVMHSILREQSVSKDSKKLIYNVIIKSIITYRIEVW